MEINGYSVKYDPTNSAYDNGCVYEHRINAQIQLGRKLKSGEEVHHLDENKKNNNIDNLMVFQSKADHTAYHNGSNAIQNEDGTYYCEKKITSICPECGNNKSKNAKYCRKCSNKKRKNKRPSREMLKKLIHENSFVSIGKMFGVTDNAVRKWCKYYDLPFKRCDLNKTK